MKNFFNRTQSEENNEKKESGFKKAGNLAKKGLKLYAKGTLGLLGAAAVVGMGQVTENNARKLDNTVNDLFGGVNRSHHEVDNDTVNGITNFSSRVGHLGSDRYGHETWVVNGRVVATKELGQSTDDFARDCVRRFGK